MTDDDLDLAMIADALKGAIGDHAAEWLERRLALLERAASGLESMLRIELGPMGLGNVMTWDDFYGPMLATVAEYRGETPEATLARLSPPPPEPGGGLLAALASAPPEGLTIDHEDADGNRRRYTGVRLQGGISARYFFENLADLPPWDPEPVHIDPDRHQG